MSVKVTGSSAKALDRAAAAATRLLTASAQPEAVRPAFGFVVTSDHEVAGQDPDDG